MVARLASQLISYWGRKKPWPMVSIEGRGGRKPCWMCEGEKGAAYRDG